MGDATAATQQTSVGELSRSSCCIGRQEAPKTHFSRPWGVGLRIFMVRGPRAHVPQTLKLQPHVVPARKAPRAEANADLAKEAKSRLQRTGRFCQLHSAVTRSDGQEHSAQQLLGKRQTPLLRTHPAMSKQPRKHILYWFPLLGQDLT